MSAQNGAKVDNVTAIAGKVAPGADDRAPEAKLASGSDGYTPYMGVKLVEAYPQYNFQTGEAGYKVRYPDGYESWSPKLTFEQAYLPLDPEDPTRVTAQVVRGFLPDTLQTQRVGNHTVGYVTLRNGFALVESAACVDEANYDEAVGAKIISRKASEKAWGFLGFVLAWARNGLASPVSEEQDEAE